MSKKLPFPIKEKRELLTYLIIYEISLTASFFFFQNPLGNHDEIQFEVIFCIVDIQSGFGFYPRQGIGDFLRGDV